MGRLVSVLEASWSVLAANFSHAILDAIFEWIFGNVGSENQTPNCEKSLNYINFFFLLPGDFNIRSLPHANFIPTWVNLASFWRQKPTKIASGSDLIS